MRKRETRFGRLIIPLDPPVFLHTAAQNHEIAVCHRCITKGIIYALGSRTQAFLFSNNQIRMVAQSARLFDIANIQFVPRILHRKLFLASVSDTVP